MKGIFFAECDGEKFVELTSLAKRVQNNREGERALRAVWRRAGHDVLIPDIDGVRGVAFPGQRGHPREKLMPAANLRGFEAYVRELNEDDVDANEALLRAVASAAAWYLFLQLLMRLVTLQLGIGDLRAQRTQPANDAVLHAVLRATLSACPDAWDHWIVCQGTEASAPKHLGWRFTRKPGASGAGPHTFVALIVAPREKEADTALKTGGAAMS